jgi:transcriptional regulator with XRE-family HTH domain
MRNEELASGQHPGDDHREQRPSLTIAEAAKACGVSASTIRRYLRAGRFPSAPRAPSPGTRQSWQWRIPPEDLPAAGLDRRRPPSDHGREQQSRDEPAGGRPAEDRTRVLENALELERIRRQAAEALVAEQARTIARLKMALRAFEQRRREPAPDRPVTATSASSPAGVEQTPEPAPRPDGLRKVPTPRRARDKLSQEERAAIIGRALSRERPAKRRWWWR